MKRISIQLDDGAALSALTVGEGRPLIMIPGWSQTSAEWAGTVESLSAIRSVIALDMRGHGESEKTRIWLSRISIGARSSRKQ